MKKTLRRALAVFMTASLLTPETVRSLQAERKVH